MGAWVVSVSSSLGVPAVRRSTMALALSHSLPVPSNESNSIIGGRGVGVANETVFLLLLGFFKIFQVGVDEEGGVTDDDW